MEPVVGVHVTLDDLQIHYFEEHNLGHESNSKVHRNK